MKKFIQCILLLFCLAITQSGFTQTVTVTKNQSGGFSVNYSGKTETIPGLYYNTNETRSINLYTTVNLPRSVFSKPLFPIMGTTPNNWVINGHSSYTTVSQVTAALDSLIIPSSFTKEQLDTTYVQVKDGFELKDSVYFESEVNALLSGSVRNVVRTTTKVTHTGNTSKTLLYTDTIPANTFTANSTIFIKHLCHATGTAGSKYCVVEFNNVEVSRVQMGNSDIGSQGETVMYCRSTTSQVSPNTSNATSSQMTNSGFAPKTYTFNLAQDIIVKLYVTLPGSGDSAGWEAFMINYIK